MENPRRGESERPQPETLQQIWRAFGLQPHRSETFKLSTTDPLLIEKVREIVGLYMHPPSHAVVFCVDDDKAQIQRRTGRSPCCGCGRGQVERRTHDHVGMGRPRCLRRSI